MANDQYKLKFVIDADGRTAKQELNALYGSVNTLGGGFTRTFGGAIPLMNAAALGVAAVGAAAVVAGVALFNITKNASEYGSAIFDASQKTGLGAESISSLKVAADQSGSSLDSVTSGIAKFSKNVVAAGEDTEKTTAFIKDFGLSPQEALTDLDSALASVFRKIYEARPGVEQITLAQRAFGKAGADLIPVIKATNGDLDAFKQKCKELGITLDDDAARAADEFGDQLDTLNLQIAGVGRTIGTAFMPIFNDMAREVSQWMSANQGEIKRWANTSADFIVGVAAYWRDARDAVNSYADAVADMAGGPGSRGANALSETAQLIMFGPSYPLVKGAEFLAGKAVQRGRDVRGVRPAIGGGVAGFVGEAADLDTGTKAKKGRDDAERARREAERAEEERLRVISRGLQREIQERAAADAIILARYKADLAQGILTEEEAMRFRQNLEERFLEFKIQKLNEEIAAYAGRTEDIKELESRLKQLQHQQEEQLEKNREENAEAEHQRMERALADLEAEIQKMVRLMDLEEERARRNKLASPPLDVPEAAENPDQPGNFDIFSGSFLGNLDDATGRVRTMDDVMRQLGDTAADAFMRMGEGLGASLETWTLLGDQADISMRKLVASVLGGVAAQAATLAIFHTAMGIAALTPWGAAIYGPAPLHFKAAAIWGTVAVGAALLGRGIAGDSFKDKQGSASGAGANASAGDQVGEQPFSRASENAYDSGRRDVFREGFDGRGKGVFRDLHDLLSRFADKIDSASPGDVFMRGMSQNRGAVGDQAVRDIRSNSGTGRALATAIGL